MKRLILPLFAAVAATVIAYANPDRFAPGRYVITMVTNSHNKQRYIDPNEGQLWIDIGADSVRLVKTTILYTPKFGEGESLDLSMEIVSTKEKSVAYTIVDFPERTDDDGTVYHVCRCLTADGVPQDYTEALKWWRKAADKGSARASRALEKYME